MRPMWRNFFENSATVQADHRALALTTTAAALGMFLYARRGAGGGALWTTLPPAARVATSTTAGLVTAQASSHHSKKYVTTDRCANSRPREKTPFIKIACLRLFSTGNPRDHNAPTLRPPAHGSGAPSRRPHSPRVIYLDRAYDEIIGSLTGTTPCHAVFELRNEYPPEVRQQ